MNINRNELQEALSIVKPGLANKEILEQATSFAFLSGRVITFNDEVSISHPINLELEGAIKAEELYGLLSKLKTDEVTLEQKEGELFIKSGRVKAGLSFESEIRLPLEEVPSKWKTIPDVSKLKEALKLASQSCSSDMSRPKLTCVCIRDEKVYGSDGYRLFEYDLGFSFGFDSDVLIPASVIADMNNINYTKICLEEGWIHLKSKQGTIFSCRIVNEDYLEDAKLREVFEMNKPSKIVLPDKVLDMLGRAELFARKKHAIEEIIHIIISDGKLEMKAQAEETGSWISDKVNIDFKGNVEFNITPSLFRGILTKVKTLNLNKDISKVVFTYENWSCVIMLRGKGKES